MYCFLALSFGIHPGMEAKMELECAKYGEKVDAEQAVCRHPGDYCQHKNSCIIHFIERENRGKKTQNEKKAARQD